MIRSALLTSAFALVGASVALAMGPRVESYGVEGYLDRAPESAQVIDEIAIRHGETSRTLYVTAVAGDGTVEICPSCDGLFNANGPFLMGGDEEAIDRILATPEGGKVSAHLTRPRADLHVIVDQVVTDDANDVAEQGAVEPRI